MALTLPDTFHAVAALFAALLVVLSLSSPSPPFSAHEKCNIVATLTALKLPFKPAYMSRNVPTISETRGVTVVGELSTYLQYAG